MLPGLAGASPAREQVSGLSGGWRLQCGTLSASGCEATGRTATHGAALTPCHRWDTQSRIPSQRPGRPAGGGYS